MSQDMSQDMPDTISTQLAQPSQPTQPSQPSSGPPGGGSWLWTPTGWQLQPAPASPPDSNFQE